MIELSADFIRKVNECNDVQLDIAFAVLKYREIGILRKAKCFAFIFGADEYELIESLPKAVDGRILDKVSRSAINNVFLKRAKK